MAGLAPLQLCNILETELQKIAGCLYDNIEVGRSNYKAAQVIEANTRTELTEMVSAHPIKPDDLNCTTIDVRVNYKKPNCNPEPKDCATVTFGCTTAASSAQEFESCRVTMEECVADEFTVKASAFDCDCLTTVTDELAVALTNSVRAGYKDYTKKLLTKVAAGVGKTYDGADVIELKLFKEDKDGCISLQPMGAYRMKQEAMRQSPNCPFSPVSITGSEKFDAYNEMINGGYFAGTNTTAQNATQLQGFVYDPCVAEILKDTPATCEGALHFLPGSISLLEWYCFDNANYAVTPGGRIAWAPQFMGNKILRQKVDVGTEILGVPFTVDLEMFYDECDTKGGSVTVRWRKCFDVFKIPQEAFCPGTEYNHCFLSNIICDAYTCQDICTPC